jgi:hypothetical protein
MGADPPVIVSQATMTVSGDRPETPRSLARLCTESQAADGAMASAVSSHRPPG